MGEKRVEWDCEREQGKRERVDEKGGGGRKTRDVTECPGGARLLIRFLQKRSSSAAPGHSPHEGKGKGKGKGKGFNMGED